MPIVLSPPSERPRVPLTARLAALGRSRRRVALASGTFSLVGYTLAAVLLTCALDAWLHLASLPRALGLTGTLAIARFVWFRRIVPAFRLRTDSLSIALELEERFPRLNDSLASAVSFLGEEVQADDRGVSNRLRHAAVKRAERLSDRHDFARLVQSGRCWRRFGFCVLIAMAGLVVDGGNLFLLRQKLQTAVDAAALSAAVVMPSASLMGHRANLLVRLNNPGGRGLTVTTNPNFGGPLAHANR